MAENVTITNNLDFLTIQALGWEYNLWSVIIVDVLYIVLFILVSFIVFCIGIKFDWW